MGMLNASPAPGQGIRDSSVSLTIALPVVLSKLVDMDFGSLAVTSRGTAVVSPVTDAVSTTGGVNVLGGSPHAAHFRIVASRLTLVFIQIPSTPLTLTRVGGTETITLSNWTMSGLPIRILTNQAASDFGVGGSLQIQAGQAEGTYTSTFQVVVNYF